MLYFTQTNTAVFLFCFLKTRGKNEKMNRCMAFHQAPSAPFQLWSLRNTNSTFPALGKQTKTNEYLIFSTQTFLSTHVITYVSPHLANALITRDLSSPVCPVRSCFLCHCPPHPFRYITWNVQGPCKYFEQRTFTQRYLLNLMARCLSLTAPPSESPK